MSNYELEQAKIVLEITKEELKRFLISSYTDSKHKKPGDSASDLMKYLDEVINSMIKRQAIRVEFSHGASPSWYAEVFRYFSVLIEQENNICNLLSKQINDS